MSTRAPGAVDGAHGPGRCCSSATAWAAALAVMGRGPTHDDDIALLAVTLTG